MDFATLMPHFNKEGEALLSRIGLHVLLNDFDLYPDGLKPVVPFLVASIVHHEQFLRNRLGTQHPLFQQCLFVRHVADGKTAVELLRREHVRCGVNNVNPETQMTATGIPPHLILANELKEVKVQISSLQATMKTYQASMESEFHVLMGAIDSFRTETSQLKANVSSDVAAQPLAVPQAVSTLIFYSTIRSRVLCPSSRKTLLSLRTPCTNKSHLLLCKHWINGTTS
jgi:hypothetical protein